jgi:MoxR-like ATPase
MNHAEFAQQILAQVAKSPSTLPAIGVDDTRSNNAGRCMTALICHRLAQEGIVARHIRHTTFEWGSGVLALRNARIKDHHWSTYQLAVGKQLHELAMKNPLAYVLTFWALDDGLLHVWAIPEDVADRAFALLPTHTRNNCKTIEVSPEDHQLLNAPSAPNFAAYYAKLVLSEAEVAKLAEAIKTDDNIKQERQAEGEDRQGTDGMSAESSEVDDEEGDDQSALIYSEQTVAFVLELPDHVDDGEWHDQNKRRYQRVLRDPSQAVVERIAARYIQRLNPTVAAGKRHLAILKKNDYGQGGYHAHYWFAFYDPAAGSKIKSVQLFVHFLGRRRLWGYGLAMGSYCDEYMSRLLRTIAANRAAIANYLRSAPTDTIVRLFFGETQRELSPAEFADRVVGDANGMFGFDDTLTSIQIIREYPLDDLPEHAESFVDEVGTYFTWAWPFFDAAMSMKWLAPESVAPTAKLAEVSADDVDESAPKTIGELSELTALPADFLGELEDALLAKQQVVLVGPPGTSKTYIARQFARYFVRQRQGRPQGSFDALYMHANWGYEDFFEGLKPTANGGSLAFESRLGFFLEWIERLRDYDPKARHVLILDEINRCDTAAVLGELLQLLEYRGTTVRLMSGRNFVFPSNVFVIGTMNSADRSIGRMDLALRRRFLWLDLLPRPDTLQAWLDRPGNNPLGFESKALARCNELLAEREVPAQQQIGHALFMLQRIDSDDHASLRLDVPLSERKLRQIVRFSVLPYVRELLTLQLGKADDQLLQRISEELLKCVNGHATDLEPESSSNVGSA